MAEIRPIRAWRYADRFAESISDLTSPLFDVVNERQRKKLYKNPLNSIHLSVPMGLEPVENAGRALNKWKKDGTILQDPLPSIYVYYQYFSLAGSTKVYCRKGFIANIRIYEWDEKVILRHENTMPNAVNDRVHVLEETLLNVSPTHGLYSDPSHEIEHYLDEAIANPIYETEDYQGVRDVFSSIQDVDVINEIINLVREKKIILADGHHRYEGSLDYMKKCRDQNPDHHGNEPYNYHMMWFTNMDSGDLRILPTHRLITGIDDLEETTLLNKLDEDFFIKSVDNPNDVNEIILGKKWAFGLLIGDNAYKIRLKPEKISTIPWHFPHMILELDLTIMHYFIIDKVLGIRGKDQRDSDHIKFERSYTECLKEIIAGEAQLALITRDISIETVKKVCFSGYTLPQKSTYFYPKVICGFLFSSIHPDEFYSSFDSSFQ